MNYLPGQQIGARVVVAAGLAVVGFGQRGSRLPLNRTNCELEKGQKLKLVILSKPKEHGF